MSIDWGSQPAAVYGVPVRDFRTGTSSPYCTPQRANWLEEVAPQLRLIVPKKDGSSGYDLFENVYTTPEERIKFIKDDCEKEISDFRVQHPNFADPLISNKTNIVSGIGKLRKYIGTVPCILKFIKDGAYQEVNSILKFNKMDKDRGGPLTDRMQAHILFQESHNRTDASIIAMPYAEGDVNYMKTREFMLGTSRYPEPPDVSRTPAYVQERFKNMMKLYVACVEEVKAIFDKYNYVYYDLKSGNFLYTCDNGGAHHVHIADYGGCAPLHTIDVPVKVAPTFPCGWKLRKETEPKVRYVEQENTVANAIYGLGCLLIELLNVHVHTYKNIRYPRTKQENMYLGSLDYNSTKEKAIDFLTYLFQSRYGMSPEIPFKSNLHVYQSDPPNRLDTGRNTYYHRIKLRPEILTILTFCLTFIPGSSSNWRVRGKFNNENENLSLKQDFNHILKLARDAAKIESPVYLIVHGNSSEKDGSRLEVGHRNSSLHKMELDGMLPSENWLIDAPVPH